MNDIKKSGFVAILGRPNVGKSTLLNRLVGEKISIVSEKPQTTRTKITGIANVDDTQMIFLDTPGLIRPRTKLGDYMKKVVRRSIGDVDCALLLVNPDRAEPGKTELEIIENLKQAGIPALLLINKVDTLPYERVLPVIAAYNERMDFAAIIPISAARGDGVEEVVQELKGLLPEGPAFFPEDMMTDQTERQIAADIIREKMLKLLSDEVPHGVAVEVVKMVEGDNDVLNISANIYCEKDSHKGIIIGKKGAMLKRIGTLAREDLETFFEIKVFLELWVKVKEDWRNRERILNDFGFGDKVTKNSLG